jgi:NADH:ubiquinone oxidoreductase subunit 5 (subunit L)/multisubunit Na+/H+ antiporter MnhA subunit
MSQYLQLFILIPLAGFFLSLLIPRKNERSISGIVLGTVVMHLVVLAGFVVYWLMNGHPVLDIRHATIFKTAEFEIFIDFFFDKTTAAFALMGAVLTFLVAMFSRFYLHREEGFKRFFNTILLFYAGYNIIIFSGNFETLFVGWEMLGISSFLLIAFFRDRYLPVKNGLKVISIYRLSDICLILAMWLSHHLWHENITFWKLNDANVVQAQFQQHFTLAAIITVLILVAAAAKSAQIPFSSWLPRAMEGPTTSSAIFYGALSVHIGVFLLIRTYPLWNDMLFIKIAIIAIGILTCFVASSIARVQSTVKTQIAYSSIVQIGIIFIEVALGFHILALIHFAGNAFLRTYQLLVSPSVLSYLVHNQYYSFKPGKLVSASGFNKIRNSLYILSIKEWNIDSYLQRFLWNPFKWIGKQLEVLNSKAAIILLGVIFFFGVYCYSFKDSIPLDLYDILPVIYSLIALLLVFKSFTEKGDARRGWLTIFAGQFYFVLSIALNEQFGYDQILIYLSGTVIAAIVGYICLNKIKAIDGDIELNRFHGYTYEQRWIGFVFLLCCLTALGFPITPTFIGIDVLFTHIHEKQGALIAFTALSFVFIELSVLRIYARIFLGQHKKAYHAIAYRSS